MRTKELFKFIKERHAIYLRRQAGLPRPWTKDPILQTYRFCNVFRELDTVTDWIAVRWRGEQVWRDAYAHRAKTSDELRYTWFAICVARFINLPAAMEELGYPVPWDAKHYLRVMRARKARGESQMNGAYKIKPGPHKGIPTVDYIAKNVLGPLWKDREKISAIICNETLGTVPPPTLALVHELLMRYNGLGSFMAAQVVADLKYTPPLRNAVDWHTWAAPGPGSKRGLNRVCRLDPYSPWRPTVWLATLQTLRDEINVLAAKHPVDVGGKKIYLEPLHAMDVQNVNCEFDKYERTRLGEGRPKRKFNGLHE